MTHDNPVEIFSPGEFIREEIEARNWTQETLAEVLGRSVRLVNEILNGRRSITPETAVALGQAFGTSAQVWLNLESAYQLSKVDRESDLVARRSKLYSKAPVKDMIKRRKAARAEKVKARSRVRDIFRIPGCEPREGAAMPVLRHAIP